MNDLRRCAWAESHPLLRDYHDHAYGVRNDAGQLLEQLPLEMFQARLPRLTMLEKTFRFAGGEIANELGTSAGYPSIRHDPGCLRIAA